MKKEEILSILDESINAIEKKNYEAKFINGGYSYSDNLTCIFKILSESEYRNIFGQSIAHYSYNYKKYLEKVVDPDEYTFEECIIYFNWLWHVEGTGLSSGIIMKRIEQGKYLKALLKFKNYIQNDKLVWENIKNYNK